MQYPTVTARRRLLRAVAILTAAGLLGLTGGCVVAPIHPVEPTSMTCEEHLRAAERAEANAARYEAASRTTATSFARGSHWMMKNAAERERRRAAAHQAAILELEERGATQCGTPATPPPPPTPSAAPPTIEPAP